VPRIESVTWRGRWAAAAIAVVAAAACEPEAPVRPELARLRLVAEGPTLRDAEGRQVLLRGVNAGGRSKFEPFFPFPFAESGLPDQAGEPPFDEAMRAYVDRIVEWGLDVVRLQLSWEALEPTRGVYDDVYLERYSTLAGHLGSRGIRVVVDFHQDVFAAPLCGDGFPLWALPDPDMQPRTDCDAWYMGYMGDAGVDEAFEHFWADEDGVIEAFEAMWRHVAARLWSVEGVIGFEVMNEPYPGTADDEAWARDVLTPFYARMAQVIRDEAPGALIFIDAPGTDAPEGETAVSVPAGGGFVFAPHYYSPSVYIFGPDTGTYDTVAELQPWAALRDDWGVPLLVGEFGSVTGTEGGGRYMSACLDALDSYLLHGAAWQYSTTRDDWNAEGYSVTGYGGEETPSAEALVRAYPRAVSGDLVSFAFDAETLEATVVFEARPGVTEIAAPARLYPDGPASEVGGVDATATYDAEAELLLIETAGAGRATVTLGPR
jgi:endoglycosylceramidase